MDAPFTDDEKFKFYCKFSKIFIYELTKKSERVKATRWFIKIRNSIASPEEKLKFIKIFLFLLIKRKLVGIFSHSPSEKEISNDSLKSLSLNGIYTKFPKLVNQINENGAPDKGGGGDGYVKTKMAPFASTESSDKKEYVAVQNIPHFGVQAYYTISSEPFKNRLNGNSSKIVDAKSMEEEICKDKKYRKQKYVDFADLELKSKAENIVPKLSVPCETIVQHVTSKKVTRNALTLVKNLATELVYDNILASGEGVKNVNKEKIYHKRQSIEVRVGIVERTVNSRENSPRKSKVKKSSSSSSVTNRPSKRIQANLVQIENSTKLILRPSKSSSEVQNAGTNTEKKEQKSSGKSKFYILRKQRTNDNTKKQLLDNGMLLICKRKRSGKVEAKAEKVEKKKGEAKHIWGNRDLGGEIITQSVVVALSTINPTLKQKNVPLVQNKVPLEQYKVPLEQKSQLEQEKNRLEQNKVPLEQKIVPLEQKNLPLEQRKVPLEQRKVTLKYAQDIKPVEVQTSVPTFFTQECQTNSLSSFLDTLTFPKRLTSSQECQTEEKTKNFDEKSTSVSQILPIDENKSHSLKKVEDKVDTKRKKIVIKPKRRKVLEKTESSRRAMNYSSVEELFMKSSSDKATDIEDLLPKTKKTNSYLEDKYLNSPICSNEDFEEKYEKLIFSDMEIVESRNKLESEEDLELARSIKNRSRGGSSTYNVRIPSQESEEDLEGPRRTKKRSRGGNPTRNRIIRDSVHIFQETETLPFANDPDFDFYGYPPNYYGSRNLRKFRQNICSNTCNREYWKDVFNDDLFEQETGMFWQESPHFGRHMRNQCFPSPFMIPNRPELYRTIYPFTSVCRKDFYMKGEEKETGEVPKENRQKRIRPRHNRSKLMSKTYLKEKASFNLRPASAPSHPYFQTTSEEPTSTGEIFYNNSIVGMSFNPESFHSESIFRNKYPQSYTTFTNFPPEFSRIPTKRSFKSTTRFHFENVEKNILNDEEISPNFLQEGPMVNYYLSDSRNLYQKIEKCLCKAECSLEKYKDTFGPLTPRERQHIEDLLDEEQKWINSVRRKLEETKLKSEVLQKELEAPKTSEKNLRRRKRKRKQWDTSEADSDFLDPFYKILLKTSTRSIVPNFVDSRLKCENQLEVKKTLKTPDLAVPVKPAPAETPRILRETAKVPVEPVKVSVRTAKVPVETPKISKGTAKVPVETPKFSKGTAKDPVETAKVSIRTAKIPVESAKVCIRTVKFPIETAKVSIGTTKVPVETAKFAFGTAKVPVETAKFSFGTAKGNCLCAKVSTGSVKVPVVTAKVSEGKKIMKKRSRIPKFLRSFEPISLEKEKAKVRENRGCQPDGTRVQQTPNRRQSNQNRYPPNQRQSSSSSPNRGRRGSPNKPPSPRKDKKSESTSMKSTSSKKSGSPTKGKRSSTVTHQGSSGRYGSGVMQNSSSRRVTINKGPQPCITHNRVNCQFCAERMKPIGKPSDSPLRKTQTQPQSNQLAKLKDDEFVFKVGSVTYIFHNTADAEENCKRICEDYKHQHETLAASPPPGQRQQRQRSSVEKPQPRVVESKPPQQDRPCKPVESDQVGCCGAKRKKSPQKRDSTYPEAKKEKPKKGSKCSSKSPSAQSDSKNPSACSCSSKRSTKSKSSCCEKKERSPSIRSKDSASSKKSSCCEKKKPKTCPKNCDCSKRSSRHSYAYRPKRSKSSSSCCKKKKKKRSPSNQSRSSECSKRSSASKRPAKKKSSSSCCQKKKKRKSISNLDQRSQSSCCSRKSHSSCCKKKKKKKFKSCECDTKKRPVARRASQSSGMKKETETRRTSRSPSTRSVSSKKSCSCASSRSSRRSSCCSREKKPKPKKKKSKSSCCGRKKRKSDVCSCSSDPSERSTPSARRKSSPTRKTGSAQKGDASSIHSEDIPDCCKEKDYYHKLSHKKVEQRSRTQDSRSFSSRSSASSRSSPSPKKDEKPGSKCCTCSESKKGGDDKPSQKEGCKPGSTSTGKKGGDDKNYQNECCKPGNTTGKKCPTTSNSKSTKQPVRPVRDSKLRQARDSIYVTKLEKSPAGQRSDMKSTPKVQLGKKPGSSSENPFCKLNEYTSTPTKTNQESQTCCQEELKAIAVNLEQKRLSDNYAKTGKESLCECYTITAQRKK